jgi:hypothetical protein
VAATWFDLKSSWPLADLEHIQQRLKELEAVIAQRCGVSKEAVIIATMAGVGYFTATS